MNVTCGQCGEPFEAVRVSARLCSPACRQRASRAARNTTGYTPKPPRIAAVPSITPPPPPRPVAPQPQAAKPVALRPEPPAPPRPAVVLSPPAPAPPVRTEEWPLVTATRRELDEAGVLDTVAGHLALQLAAQVCTSRDTGSAKAAASKEFRAVMADALKDVATKADSLDELASRRLKRASGA